MAVEGTTDKAGPQMDLDVSLLPDANLNSVDYTRVGWYWYEGYKGIKYANVLIARIENVEFENEAEKNAILGEVFGGRVYKLDNFSGPGGTNSNVKEEGYNFYYDWVMKQSNFYNKGVKHKWAEYKMSVHHVLWPVPAGAINTNIKGVINQNIGYPGAENNIPPLIVPKEGTVLGPDAQ